MLAILCAMQSEGDVFLSQMQVDRADLVLGGRPLYVGSAYGKACVLLISGVGKVNAAMGTQYLIDHYPVKTLVSIGVAGGVAGKVELGKTYLVSAVGQYDFDTSPIDGTPVGYSEDLGGIFLTLDSPLQRRLGKRLPTARLVTGDKFSCEQALNDFVERHFDGAELREMEGFAVAYTAFHNGVDCVLLKGVSDYVGPESANLFAEMCQKTLGEMAALFPLIVSEEA